MTGPYLPNDVEEVRSRMLEALGLESVERLFDDLPGAVRLKGRLKLPEPASEQEVKEVVRELLSRNQTYSRNLLSFLGGGVWPHHVPAVVDLIANRAEFLTSYTPYQAEVNQGLLQALFEYQSLICELLDMDAANCSMYDWASSLGEAARMCQRVTGRRRFVVPRFIHPHRLATLRAYAEPAGMEVVEVSHSLETGELKTEELRSKLDRDTAGVYIENPAFLGNFMEDVDEVASLTHAAGALFVVGVDPISLGVVKPPGAYGADIVVGEGQPLGGHMNLGGPLLGIFACRAETNLLRQLPGRVVGFTSTLDGRRGGYCLALQSREQHIKREKATSNISTNNANMALRAAVFIALLGSEGFRRLGEAVLAISHYAMKRLGEIPQVKVPLFTAAHFKEFTVNFNEASRKLSVSQINRRLLSRGIQGGLDVGQFFPELRNTALYCVTEVHTPAQVERLGRVLEEALRGA